jgi:hypothetical protein
VRYQLFSGTSSGNKLEFRVWKKGRVCRDFLVGDFVLFGEFEVIPLATEKNSDPFIRQIL